MKKKENNYSSKVAGRTYQPEEGNRQDEVSSGLATTYEQASDTWTEGEINATIDHTESGEDIKIPRKGYGK